MGCTLQIYITLTYLYKTMQHFMNLEMPFIEW